MVLDVGGEATFDQSVTATRDGGCIAVLGALGHGARALSLTEVLMRRILVQGIFVGSRADLVRYLGFVETHGITPLIDRVFEGVIGGAPGVRLTCCRDGTWARSSSAWRVAPARALRR